MRIVNVFNCRQKDIFILLKLREKNILDYDDYSVGQNLSHKFIFSVTLLYIQTLYYTHFCDEESCPTSQVSLHVDLKTQSEAISLAACLHATM